MSFPQLEAIVGHAQVVQELGQQLRDGQTHHALLFYGPKGVGKASMVRALTARLLCKNPQGLRACGQCSSCAKFRDEGQHPDVFQLVRNDKGNIRLGQRGEPGYEGSVRWLQERLHKTSTGGVAKVGWVFDAESMQASGANALLKTLEEPPANTYLLLTTTQADRLLPTVLSRCLKLRMGPLSRNEVETVLRDRAPELDERQTARLAGYCDGAPGQALALDLDDLEEQLQTVIQLDRVLRRNQPEGPIRAVDEAANLSKDRSRFGQLLELWARWVRDQVLFVHGHSKEASFPDRSAELSVLANAEGRQRTLARLDLLLEARRQLSLPNNLNARMIAEQTFLALCGHLSVERIRPPLPRHLVGP